MFTSFGESAQREETKANLQKVEYLKERKQACLRRIDKENFLLKTLEDEINFLTYD
jgi:hypothetical protein